MSDSATAIIIRVRCLAAALRAKAIESLLVEKGLVASDAIDRIVEIYEHDVGPLNGARVVARAWTDPAYKSRLLKRRDRRDRRTGIRWNPGRAYEGGGEYAGGA